MMSVTRLVTIIAVPVLGYYFTVFENTKSENSNFSFNILELDILVAVMFALSVIHAAANNHLGFLSAIGLYACATEQAAVRLGRTHCHRTDTGLMVSKCSSLNSVGYYIPWLYACFISARRLAGNTWGCIWLCAALHFGFCGPYEMQGPSLNWWKYPDADGFIAKGDYSDTWTLDSIPEGLKTTNHVMAALNERWHGMPVMAPLFHSAVGFGLAAGMKICNDQFLPALLLTNPIALLWDVPCRIVEAMIDFPRLYMVSILLTLTPLMGYGITTKIGKANTCDYSKSGSLDILLFVIPVINAAYFTSCFWRFPAYIPADLYIVAASVCALSVIGHAAAAGLLSSTVSQHKLKTG